MQKEEFQKQGSVAEVFKTFFVLGCTSFGGPVAHIGYFRKELVQKRSWISEEQFAQLFALCQFLPGPASSQLGFSLGLVRAGWLGALAAFLAFTLPSAILLVTFVAFLPMLSGDIGQAAIHGLKLVACAVVADALWGMGKKLCPDTSRRVIALIGLLMLLSWSSPWCQVLVVLMGGLSGYIFLSPAHMIATSSLRLPLGRRMGMSLFILFLAFLFGFPILASLSDNLLVILAESFYRAGALVFGGGHVVLPLLEQATVGEGLISQESFLAGYGASQAIPGPLFTFAVYLGALIPTSISPELTALLTLTFMFLPGFLLIAAALPYWQSITENQSASRVVVGINAAVVGILAAALYEPIVVTSVAGLSDLLIVLIALVMLMKWSLSPLWVVLWCLLASMMANLF